MVFNQDVTTIVYTGYAGVSGNGKKFFTLRTPMSTPLYQELKDLKISAEPGNDDVVNFYIGYNPSLAHSYAGTVNIMKMQNFFDRYSLGKLLKEERFSTGEDGIYEITYQQPDLDWANSEINSRRSYYNLWGDGILEFVCKYLPYFITYLTQVKTMQMFCEDKSAVSQRIGLSGLVTKREEFNDEMFATLIVKDHVSGSQIKESVNNMELLQEMFSKYSTMHARTIDKVVKSYEMKLSDMYRNKLTNVVRFVEDLGKIGWTIEKDGYYFRKRIDVIYFRYHNKVYDVHSGDFWLDELYVPFGDKIQYVRGKGKHPHVFSDNRICTGNLDPGIENITKLPELLKTVVYDGGTAGKVSHVPEYARIISRG